MDQQSDPQDGHGDGTGDPTAKPPFGLTRRAQIVILAALAVVVAGVYVFGSRRDEVKDAPVAAAPAAAGYQLDAAQWATVKTAPVRQTSFQPQRFAEGNIAVNGDRTTPVYPPYSGRVSAVLVREGERVERGQALFAIESTDLVQAQNDFLAATAAASKARAQVALLQTIEQRAHQLFDAKGGALKDWQQAQTDLANARNDLKSAEVALAATQDRLHILGQSDATIAALASTGHTSPELQVAAPIAGYVIQRRLGLGQYLSQGASDPVFTIGELSTVWLVANVRETDAPFVQVGQAVKVRVTAFPTEVFDARITFVAAAVEAATRRLPIRAEVGNPDRLLKPEMWAEFSIATGPPRTGLAVPSQAIVYEGDTARVWVADAQHRISAHVIRTGIVNGADVEALSGVAAGDQVITQGSIFIDRAAAND